MKHLKVQRKGAHRVVCFLAYSDANCPASDFLDRPENGIAKGAYRAYFLLVANNARPDIPTTIWKPLRSKKSKYDCTDISELRHLGSKTRLLMFTHRCGTQECLVITHGISKKEDGFDDAEVKRVIDARTWFLKNHECKNPPSSPSQGSAKDSNRRKKK